MEDILRLSRSFLISSADLNQKSMSYTSMSYRLGSLLLESHNRVADCLYGNTDADIQLALLDLAECLLNVTPYAKMATDTPSKLCNQMRTIVLNLNTLKESNKVAALRVLRSIIDTSVFKENVNSLREMSKYLLCHVYNNVFTLQLRADAAEVLASMWLSLPDLERKENVAALFSKLFNEDSLEAKASSLLLLSLHPDMVLEQDESVLDISHLLSKLDHSFQRNFLLLLGALFSEQHLEVSYDTSTTLSLMKLRTRR